MTGQNPTGSQPNSGSLPVFNTDAISDPCWFFASLIDHLPVNIICKDVDGKFIYVNQAFANLQNRPASELVGKTDFDLFPHQLASKYSTDDQSVMATSTGLQEVEEQDVGNEKHYFEIRKAPLIGVDGDVIGIEGVFWDVTAQRHAEIAAAQERFLLNSLMNNVPDSIYFKDTESRFIRISEEQAIKFGFSSPSEVLGKTDADIFSSEHAQQALSDERNIIETGQPMLNKVEKETWPDKTVTWVSTSKLPLVNDDQEVVGTFGISRDITELVLTEEALRAAKIAADSANRAKSDFLANMSHEIRTPMNAVLGITELLLDTDLSTPQRDYLNMVLSSGESLLSLINDILDFSKIESGKFELNPLRFDLRDALGDTARVLGMRAHAKELELAFSVETDVPNFLLGDIDRLRQIVVNLVGNAIKFTNTGEVVITVECKSIVKDSVTLLVKVTDTGVGIPPSKLDLVFQEFEQADSSTTRDYGGTGLGLAISSRLVELMGGDIWVESEVEKGSTFAFTAKMKTAEDSPAPIKAQPIVVEGTSALIVDDNETNRRILNDMLLNWGMKPLSAESAETALRLLRESNDQHARIPLILADVNMPAMDGFEMSEIVRGEQGIGDTPIIMLTSGMRQGDLARCRELNIDFHLIKPLKQSEVFDAVISALGVEPATPNQIIDLMGTEKPAHVLNVLLVEDNIVNQKLAIGVLGQQNHRVTVANNGREAVDLWQATQFDLILMDVQMPVMDGFEATREIRRLESFSGEHIPIIAMTARALEKDRDACLAVGMDDYLSKPIRIKELAERLQRLATLIRPQPASPTMIDENAKSIDWEFAKSSVNDDSNLLLALIEVLRANTPRMIEKIESAIERDDSAALKLNAHTLKGSVLFLGKTPITVPTEQLEAIGTNCSRSGAELPQETAERLAELKTGWQTLVSELDKRP